MEFSGILKIIIILPNLRRGGTERVIVNLANEFNLRKHIVTIILLNSNDYSLKSDLSDDINIRVLYLSKFRELILRPFVFMKTMADLKPDVVFSAFGEINPLLAIYALFYPKVGFFARESSIPSLRLERRSVKIFYRVFYQLFDKIIVQSHAMQKDLIENYNIVRSKIENIPNPIDNQSIDDKLYLNNSKEVYLLHESDRFLLFVGTIDYNKRLDRAVLLHSKFKELGFNYKLVVLGDGPLLEEVKRIAKDSDYHDDIIFMGDVSNPYQYMARAEFLLICSNYEGFPNVGIEANYCGLPVLLSNETLGGASELIQIGLNGYIIDYAYPNVKELRHVFDRKKISADILKKHNIKTVSDKYLEAFK